MRSVLVHTNPLVLLACGVLAVAGSFAVRSLPIGFAAVGAYVAAGLVLVPGWRRVVGRFVVVGIGSVSVLYSTWLLGGHDVATAVTAGLRIVVLALPGAVLSAFVDPARLSDNLGQRLHLPARFVVAFAAALQRFERLGQTWQQLDRARRVRGFGPTWSPVSRFRHASSLTFALLVSSMRSATNMSIAMDARGFAGADARTWAEAAPWSRHDSAVLVLGAVLAAVPVVLYATGV